MDAWGRDQKAGDRVLMLADGTSLKLSADTRKAENSPMAKRVAKAIFFTMFFWLDELSITNDNL